MTIRNKLLTLVFGALLLFLAVIGTTVILYLPIVRINTEFSQLSRLAERVLLMDVQVNALLNSPLEQQWESCRIKNEELMKQFSVVGEQQHLIGINDRVAQSMKSVLYLEQLYTERWESLVETVPAMLERAERVFLSRAVSFLTFYMEPLEQYDDYDGIIEQLQELERNIDITSGALASAYDAVSMQYDIIQVEIDKMLNRLLMGIAVFFIVGLVIVVVFSLRLTSRISRSILLLENGVSRLRDGRLIADFDTSSGDEVAGLGENLNGFAEDLSASILKMKETSTSNLAMKSELTGAADNSHDSVEGISGAVTTIRSGMSDLDSRVAESGAAVNTVKSMTEELGGMLDEQTTMIEESTSAVTEMIASIDNVNEITGRKKTATDKLVKTAETGGERLERTIRIIQDITGSVDEIRGTVSVIQSVSAQTSLLAMNAAIEAAHAGEYGAGFSVVAEEIRKLAEASGISSKRIGGVIKEVVGSIEQASSSGDETKRAFADINTEVIGVASALDEIHSSMDELAAGGKQILSAMTSLQGYTADVKDGGNAMSDASESLEEAFRTVERVSGDVLSQIGGIGARVDEISNAVAVVSDISGRLSDESEKLEAEVARYDVGGTDELFSAPVIDD